MSLHFSQKMTVNLRKIGFPVLITLLSAGAIPFAANLRVVFSTPSVLAQTSDARKAEADRLFEQGIEQFQTSQYEAALQSWQQALTIYREIKNRQGEGNALGNLGAAYYSLGDYPKAIGNDNGLLTSSEILDLKLHAELVVLSACDTGKGKLTGDGVIGLYRSLISAGVPSVIVSLWAVPDAPTAALMMEFYQNLQKNPDKAQALRQAMLTTMKNHPEPKNWAAFTLIGEAE